VFTGASAIVIVAMLVTLAPAPSVAVTVSTYVPDTDGTPEIIPVFGSKVMPAGSVADGSKTYVIG